MARLRSIDDRDYYLGGIKLDHVDVEKDHVTTEVQTHTTSM